MKHKIKQKPSVLIFTLVLMVFVSHSLHHGNLAVAGSAEGQRAYEKFKQTLTRPDLLPLLPEVLRTLKDPEFGNQFVGVLSDPGGPFRGVSPPLDVEVARKLAVLLKVPEIKAMFLDAEFRRIYGDAIAIDTLLALLSTPDPRYHVRIRQVIFNPGSYSTLKVTRLQGLSIDGYIDINSTQTVIFTISDADGKPVQGLPISFSIQPLGDSAATGTFNPPVAVTDQNGNVQTQVTFGPEGGDIRFVAEVDTARIVEIVEFELMLGDTDIDRVIVNGIGERFAYTNTTQSLVFTAIDANGKRVQDAELTFSARSASGSPATATFLPTVATTNRNGEARTQITFGAQPGGVHLTVQAGPAVEQINIISTQARLGNEIRAEFTGLQVGDSVDVGSTHTLVFTAKDMRGRPVSGLPLAFAFDSSAVELEAMFNPITAVTDRRGEVRTKVTFGEKSGDFNLIVSMDPQRVIVFSEPEFRLGASNIVNFDIQGMEKGFAEPNSSINLVLTARDAVGRRVAGEELVFAIDTPPSSGVTALFDRVKVKTNKQGIAQTQVTFGSKPGVMRLIVKSGITIDAFAFDLAPYGTLELTKGLQIGDAVRANATHDLVFTATNNNGEPLPWLPLRLAAVDVNIFAPAATFTPTPRVVTNKNGKVRTSITFGDVHEDVRLVATVDRRQLIEFPNPIPKIILDDSGIDSVAVKGIERGFARIGSTRRLLFTAKGKNGKPAAGVKLEFGFRKPPDSNATVTFAPATATTDENGEAQTQVTFGENPGSIRFTVKPIDDGQPEDPYEGPWVTFRQFSTPGGIEGTDLRYDGLRLRGEYRPGSKRKVIFTLINRQSGEPVPDVGLNLSYIGNLPATATFNPAVITTDQNGQAETEITFGEQPGTLGIRVFVERWVTFTGSGYGSPSVDGEYLELKTDGLRLGGKYRPGSKHKVSFTLIKEQSREPVPDVGLSLSTNSDSTTTATFNPAVITTDQNGQAETEITLGKQTGRFGIHVELAKTWVTFSGRSLHRTTVDGEQLDVEWEGLSLVDGLPDELFRRRYVPGSTHKFIFRVTKRRTGKPVPPLRLHLSYSTANSPNSMATATFKPAVIITDKNGQAETKVTFGKQPGKLGLSVKVERFETPSVQFRYTGRYPLTYTGLQEYDPSLKRKVTFTVDNGNGEPIPDHSIRLSYNQNSTVTATFNPAVITTDQNGQAETEITFSKESGHLVIEAKEILTRDIRVSRTDLFFDSDSARKRFGLEQDELVFGPRLLGFSTYNYNALGSTDEIYFTVKNERTGEPVPDLPVRLRAVAGENYTATATFEPAVIITDQKGRAKTKITFGKQPGEMDIHLVAGVTTSRKVVLSIPNPLVSEVYDITLDGISGGSFSSEATWSPDRNGRHRESSKLDSFLSFNMKSTKTRKKLVVKLKDAQQGVDIVFDTYSDPKGIVTFEPKKVRTDRNGRAVTYVTFEAGLYDVVADIRASREVHFKASGYTPPGVFASITFGGASKNFSDDDRTVSYPFFYPHKTRKPLFVQIKDAQQDMNVEFYNIRGGVTFKPKKVRADKNGRAATYITFQEGLRDVEITVGFTLAILGKNEHGANVYSYSDGHKAVLIKGLELSVNTNTALQHDDFTVPHMHPRRDGKHFTLMRQKGNTCGQTAARMVLNYYGVELSLWAFNTIIRGHNLKTRTFGTTAEKMMAGLELLPVKAERFAGTWEGPSRRDSLREKISESRPPIIVIRAGKNSYHHIVVVGYDTKHDKFLIADPNGFFYWAPWKHLNGWWHLSEKKDNPKVLTWPEFLKRLEDTNAWGNSPLLPDADWLLKLRGDVAPYRMFVPKAAPPYHHLESETVWFTLPVDILPGNRKWTKRKNFNGDIKAWVILPMRTSVETVNKEGNKLTVSGTSHIVLASKEDVFKDPSKAPRLHATVWYEPSAAAAPVLALPPRTTALLPNYPNPFNPETWIPYHLAKPADVTLTIYAIDGKVVRHLDLGHQAAGFYQSKARAAYWDGRNNIGERVASGIYFYTLIAGDFAATQKMLILK